MQVPSLALLSELRIRHCRNRQHKLQMWLGSCVAVAVVQAGSCSSDLTLGTSTCCRYVCKKKKKKYCQRVAPSLVQRFHKVSKSPRITLCPLSTTLATRIFRLTPLLLPNGFPGPHHICKQLVQWKEMRLFTQVISFCQQEPAQNISLRSHILLVRIT